MLEHAFSGQMLSHLFVSITCFICMIQLSIRMKAMLPFSMWAGVAFATWCYFADVDKPVLPEGVTSINFDRGSQREAYDAFYTPLYNRAAQCSLIGVVGGLIGAGITAFRKRS